MHIVIQTKKWDAYRQLNANCSWHTKDNPLHPLQWADSYCELVCSANHPLRPKGEL